MPAPIPSNSSRPATPPAISVVVPTHNPRRVPLERVLAALAEQTLPQNKWDLVIVDNRSEPPIPADLALAGHPAGKVSREDRMGLTHARLCGFRETRGQIIILVDDDNVLAPDYLACVGRIAEENPHLGTWSGAIELEFAQDAKPPPKLWWSYLAYRQPASATSSHKIDDHASTPWGAGMCIRREIADAYAELVAKNNVRTALDLQGRQLIYGGDTDIAYTGCDLGYSKGVFPELRMRHLIPAERCTEEYFNRCIEGHGYSELLHRHVRDNVLENPHRTLRRWLSDTWYALKSGYDVRFEQTARQRGRIKAWKELRRL